MKKKFTVEDLIYELTPLLKLKKVVVSDTSLKNKIEVPDLNRSGLAFAGYYDYFGADRIQIVGKTEISYLEQLSDAQRKKRIKKFMSYSSPCVIFTRNLKVPSLFKDLADQSNIAILQTSMTTTRVVGNLTLHLEEIFAPSSLLHGTLIDVHGVGVLLLGGSGVGKSECALELVERGHRLVADDVVKVSLNMGRYLLGAGTSFIRHHMEIRGLGIIDVRSIYGASAVRNQKGIGFVVSLEERKQGNQYERLGLEEKKYEILGCSLPHYLIPVKPGRNIAILIEVAASTQRLKRMGVNPVAEIERKMLNIMSKEQSELDVSF